jgi:hypothetical protein
MLFELKHFAVLHSAKYSHDAAALEQELRLKRVSSTAVLKGPADFENKQLGWVRIPAKSNTSGTIEVPASIRSENRSPSARNAQLRDVWDLGITFPSIDDAPKCPYSAFYAGTPLLYGFSAPHPGFHLHAQAVPVERLDDFGGQNGLELLRVRVLEDTWFPTTSPAPMHHDSSQVDAMIAT